MLLLGPNPRRIRHVVLDDRLVRKPDLVRDLAILALRDHVLTASVFVHYLKVYFDSYSIRDIIRLRFAVELLGFMLLISTFLGAWSTGLVIYF